MLLFAATACGEKEVKPSIGTWTKQKDFPGGPMVAGVGLTIDGKGYVGLGYRGDGSGYQPEFWEYDSQQDSWRRKADFPPGPLACGAVCSFTIGKKGYVLTAFARFFAYDPSDDKWTELAGFPVAYTFRAAGFSVDGKGYVGTGNDLYTENYSKLYTHFYQYDPASNQWTRKADFAGVARTDATGFSIGSKGYLGFGTNDKGGVGSHYSDLWEYDPAADTWTRKADFPDQSCIPQRVGFTYNAKRYVTALAFRNFPVRTETWEFNPQQNAWTKLQFFQSINTAIAQSFWAGDAGYIVGGQGTEVSKHVWRFKP